MVWGGISLLSFWCWLLSKLFKNNIKFEYSDMRSCLYYNLWVKYQYLVILEVPVNPFLNCAFNRDRNFCYIRKEIVNYFEPPFKIGAFFLYSAKGNVNQPVWCACWNTSSSRFWKIFFSKSKKSSLKNQIFA